MTGALKHHWPEYLMEGTCLRLFMISAFTFGTILGMLSAAEAYVRIKGHRGLACAKLHHQNTKRCIFCGKLATQA
jgi:hypothetical protein